ncbi:hypothetical protein OW763_13815 [Clostridium aestuarii]|uniref:Uncharacterized protein n=1 Tax=Clostridium aestuarii TaxID=338193 RepID=A0ABT4D5U8_9CLOT|nr:hypothetical protein [Clostridium aestuarii]MCY6485408.1 hypothetical protein [Clostridium aestuarii]
MKIDKGFEFFYSKLSYRRKFIRTLWMIIGVLIMPLSLYFSNVDTYINIIISTLMLIIWSIQLLYTYMKYKKEKN